MNKIILEEGPDTPRVTLDPASRSFEISGRSLPEDVYEFYNPILEFLKQYAAKPLDYTDFTFKLEYFNTASSKMILDILILLQQVHKQGYAVQIQWFYRKDEEDMLIKGEDYAEMVDLPFQFHTEED
ncbi:MAG: DUF1987 domain-containing protein [Bacteroidetes bacterium]|nr:DUF1987 domain-containing protein [Bacteroidota bacterium]